MQLFDDLEDFGEFDDFVSGDVRDPYTELNRLRLASQAVEDHLVFGIRQPVLAGKLSGRFNGLCHGQVLARAAGNGRSGCGFACGKAWCYFDRTALLVHGQQGCAA